MLGFFSTVSVGRKTVRFTQQTSSSPRVVLPGIWQQCVRRGRAIGTMIFKVGDLAGRVSIGWLDPVCFGSTLISPEQRVNILT